MVLTYSVSTQSAIEPVGQAAKAMHRAIHGVPLNEHDKTWLGFRVLANRVNFQSHAKIHSIAMPHACPN